MTREAFLEYCGSVLGTEPDYPFEDNFETAVLRHMGNRKWIDYDFSPAYDGFRQFFRNVGGFAQSIRF